MPRPVLLNQTKESLAKLGDKNPMWKGAGVGLIALHEWVRNRFSKPTKCQDCKKALPYDLANKGTYNRDFKNWEWLCRRCHMVKDGRLKKLSKLAQKTGKLQKCKFCQKQFYRKKSRIKKGEGFFCSQACAGKHRTNKSIISKKCLICKKNFIGQPSEINQRKYCSRKCQYVAQRV